MMINLVLNFITMPFIIFFESGTGEAIAIPFIAGPAAGIGFYTLVYLYYRNTNKRYNFETETSTVIKNLRSADRKVDEIKGTREKNIKGRNSENHLKRVRRF